MTAVQADRRMRGLTGLAGTTPGVLGGFALVLILVALLAGALTALGVQSRVQAVDDLAARTGPLSVAAEQIYRSLSDADATATGAFLAGGLEPTAARQRYEADIAQASGTLAIAVAARDPADITAPGSALATLSEQLPVYTGLVDTARADNQQGLPLGAAYQREASTLMRTKLLPTAQDLYRTETAQVASDQDSAGAFPILELLLGLLMLGLLVVAQVVLFRRTNRVFNAGLLAATAATLVSLLWVMIAGVAVMGDIDASRRDGSAQVDVLAAARIATLAARADETLTLVARGAGQAYQTDYVQTDKQLGDLLNTAASQATDSGVRAKIDAAKADHATWTTAHTTLRKADDSGDYGSAVTVAIGAASDSAATAFDKLDGDLRDAIDQTRASFNNKVTAAGGTLGGVVAVVAVLAVLTAAGAGAGIWRRLRDYR
jgi:hypothetical protein